MKQVLEQMRNAEVELVAVIEPGTEEAGETSDMLHAYFKKGTAVSMYDAKALEKLDVLLVVNCWDIHQEALDAIETAGKAGLHLIVVSGVGIAAPETNEQTQRVAGIDGAIYGWNPKEVVCKVVKAHPLLGDIKEGTQIKLKPNGMFGWMKDATTLVEVGKMGDIWVPESEKKKEAGMSFAPLYISQIGKGKIVGIGWAAWVAIPEEIDLATDGRFYERCALWLAGRALPGEEK